MEQPQSTVNRPKNPALKCLTFLSHGTLESRDVEKTRKFYEECLGIETVRTSPISLMVRLGGNNTIAVVQNERKAKMSLLAHNGLDVPTREDVDHCHRTLEELQEKWGIKQITRPSDQHGTYSFYFCDLDDNWWEILTNPPGGYSWMFTQGNDLQAWGAGEDDKINPNAYKKKGQAVNTETDPHR